MMKGERIDGLANTDNTQLNLTLLGNRNKKKIIERKRKEKEKKKTTHFLEL